MRHGIKTKKIMLLEKQTGVKMKVKLKNHRKERNRRSRHYTQQQAGAKGSVIKSKLCQKEIFSRPKIHPLRKTGFIQLGGVKMVGQGCEGG